MPSLAQYRQRLAETAGYNLQTVSTAGATRADQVVIGSLQSTEFESTFLGNTWLYQPSGPNAGQCRRVQYQSGLDPNTGTVTVDRPFTAATPSGTSLEIYGRLPPISMEGRLGLNAIANRVLAECWTFKKLDVLATVDSQKYFQLNDAADPSALLFPWLTSEDQIIDVYSRGADSISNPAADDQLMATWRWMANADNPTLETGRALQTGDMLRILAIVPMAWWIKPSGQAWQMPSTPGLQADADQALLDLNGMEIVGKVYIFDELSKWGIPDDQANYRTLSQRARAAANQYKRLSLQRPVRRTMHWPASLAVPSRWGYAYGSDWGMVTRA